MYFLCLGTALFSFEPLSQCTGPLVVPAQVAPFTLILCGSQQKPLMTVFLYHYVATTTASSLPSDLPPPGHSPSLCCTGRWCVTVFFSYLPLALLHVDLGLIRTLFRFPLALPTLLELIAPSKAHCKTSQGCALSFRKVSFSTDWGLRSYVQVLSFFLSF